MVSGGNATAHLGISGGKDGAGGDWVACAFQEKESIMSVPIDETRLHELLAFRSKGTLQHQVDQLLLLAQRNSEAALAELSKRGFTREYERLSHEGEEAAKTEHQLSSIMVDRNLIGRELEKAGRVDEAIALYEANVDDLFAGSAPYDGLACIYRKQKRYSDEVRVLEQALKVASSTMNPRKLERFQSRLAKAKELQAKMG